MSLSNRSKEYNVQQSITKYFVDRFPNNKLLFDKTLSTPDIRSQRKTMSWYSIYFDDIVNTSPGHEMYLKIVVNSRNDPNGIELTKLRDNLFAEFENSGYRIPLYSFPDVSSIGKMMVYVENDGGKRKAEDETNFKIINLKLKWMGR